MADAKQKGKNKTKGAAAPAPGPAASKANFAEAEAVDGAVVEKTAEAPPPKSGSDDDFDFGDLDDDLKAYVGGEDGDQEKGGGNQWTKIMAEAQAAADEADEDEDEEEEDEEEEEGEGESEEEEEEESGPPRPSIFDPKDDDMPREYPDDRKFFLQSDSFITLVDPGLSQALLPKEEAPEKVYKGLKAVKQEYKKLCEELGIKPNKKFLDNMTSEELDMTDYGLNDRDIIAMCHSLCNNTFIKKLSLRGAACGLQGGLAIAEMIENNYTIMDLDLSSTEIKPAFEEICISVGLNIVLEIFNVSINELGDKEMAFVAGFLKESSTMRVLNLSRNWIGDLGAFHLGKGLVVNTSLEKLDLGWNRLRGTKKGFPMYDAIAKHPSINTLDIWGNTIGDAGVRGITRVLSLNLQLDFMNISYNRLGDKACGPVGKSVARSEALTHFIAGPNIWRERDAIKMLSPLANRNKVGPLQTMDFSTGLLVGKHFLKWEKKVLRTRPDLEIIHGESYGLRRRPRPDPKALVIQRAKIVCENFATPLEMLIDELRTEPKTMKEADFKKFIKSCNLYKDKVMTESFFRNFYLPKTMEVDCEAIIAAYDKEFPPKPGKLSIARETEQVEGEVKPDVGSDGTIAPKRNSVVAAK